MQKVIAWPFFVCQFLRFISRRSLWVGAIAVFLAWNFWTAVALAQTVLIQEQFSAASADPNWIAGIGSNRSNFPCLTAAPPTPTNPPVITDPNNFPIQQPLSGCPVGTVTDPIGQGVLRLTSPQNAQAGFVFYRVPVPSTSGLVITFDQFQYGGTGADGINFFIADGTGTLPTRAGAFGGSLGYAQRAGSTSQPAGVPGLQGGYVGIGFDAFGLYSDGSEGRVGGVGPRANAIVIRGSQATQYNYVTGVPFPIYSPANNTRALAQRRVRITLTPSSQITIEVDSGTGFSPVITAFDLTTIPGQGPLPSQLIFGFAGSTGSRTNFNEIQDFRVTTLTPLPDLSITKTSQGDFLVGNPGVYTLTVQNAATAGATTGAITVTDTLPNGFQFVSATGTNWTCSANGQLVTCTYNTIAAPGETLPAISLTVLPTAIANDVENVATVTTPGEINTGDNTGRDRTNVTEPGAPTLRLVKRISNILRGGSSLSGVNFSQFVDDPNDSDDDATGWAAFPPTGIFALPDGASLQSGDEIEYTVYLLSDGGSAAQNVNVCDQIPLGTQLIENTPQIKQGNNPALPGGQVFSPLAPLPNGNPCQNQTNPNGSILFSFGTVPNTAGNNFGFGRFRVRIN